MVVHVTESRTCKLTRREAYVGLHLHRVAPALQRLLHEGQGVHGDGVVQSAVGAGERVVLQVKLVGQQLRVHARR